MLRNKHTTAVGVLAVTTDNSCNNLHGVGIHVNWLSATPQQRLQHQPACSCRHGRRWHHPHQHPKPKHHKQQQCCRQPFVCDPSTSNPGREGCDSSLFATTVAFNPSVLRPSVSTECLHDYENFHPTAFPVVDVHNCGVIDGDYGGSSANSAMESSFADVHAVGSESSDAARGASSSSTPIGYGFGAPRGDHECIEDVGVVLRRSVLAGVRGSPPVDVPGNVPGQGLLGPQVPVLSERADGEGSDERQASLRLRPVSTRRRAEVGTTDAAVRVCGTTGGVLHRSDQRQCKDWCVCRKQRQGKQRQPAETQGTGVGGCQRTHVLSHTPHDATVQETAVAVAATSCETSHQQEPEGGDTPTVGEESAVIQPACEPVTPANTTVGLPERVPLHPLTQFQRFLYDNQSNYDRSDKFVDLQCCKHSKSITSVVQVPIVDIFANNFRKDDDRCSMQQESVKFSSLINLSSVKTSINVVGSYFSLVFFLLVICRLQRTEQDHYASRYNYEHNKWRSVILERLWNCLDCFSKTVKLRNCESYLFARVDNNNNGYRINNVVC